MRFLIKCRGCHNQVRERQSTWPKGKEALENIGRIYKFYQEDAKYLQEFLKHIVKLIIAQLNDKKFQAPGTSIASKLL